MKKKIAAFFRAYANASVTPDAFFLNEDPNEIAEALGKFSPEEFRKIADENDGSWQLCGFIAPHFDLSIRGLTLTNSWWRDCGHSDNSYIGEGAFSDGMSPAEENFKNMPLGEQIDAFLAIGAPDDPWRISDAIELSKHLKLDGVAGTIRDHLVAHRDSRIHEADLALSPDLFKILVITLTEKKKGVEFFASVAAE